MTTLSYQTALVFIPPDDIWEPIQRIRRRYDQKLRRWMPHITLRYPFVHPAAFDLVTGPIAAACAATPAFDITLAQFGVFPQRRHSVVWLAPEPAESLLALHQTLVAALPHEAAQSRPFRPHMTVGQVSGRAAREHVLAELAAAWQPLAFVADRLSLIARGTPPGDVFQVEHTFWLKPRLESGAVGWPAVRV